MADRERARSRVRGMKARFFSCLSRTSILLRVRFIQCFGSIIHVAPERQRYLDAFDLTRVMASSSPRDMAGRASTQRAQAARGAREV